MKTISIKSVLSELAMTIDDRYWNEAVMLEHAAKGFLQMNLVAKFEDKVALIDIADYKGTLPDDLRYVTMIAAKVPNSNKYIAMKAATNAFHNKICRGDALTPCPTCTYDFSISANGIITVTFQEGTVAVAYVGVPLSDEGDILIPDDEVVKQAIMHYVLYKYWLTKDMMKEEGAGQRMAFHLKMWSTLSKKALNINMPTVSQLENLKEINNRLVPRSHQFENFFQNLNTTENLTF